MITKNLIVEIKNLTVNQESPPIKLSLANPAELTLVLTQAMLNQTSLDKVLMLPRFLNF